MRPLTLARIAAILDARLVRAPVGLRRRSVGVPTLRMVLFSIARHEGEKLTLATIQDETAVCGSSVWSAVETLVRLELVTRLPGSMKAGRRYRIQWSKLGERREAAA